MLHVKYNREDQNADTNYTYPISRNNSVPYNMCYLEKMNTYQQNKNENLECKSFMSYTSRSRQTKKRGIESIERASQWE